MVGVKVLRPFTIQERDRINIRIIHPDFKNCILHLDVNIGKIVFVTLTSSHTECIVLMKLSGNLHSNVVEKRTKSYYLKLLTMKCRCKYRSRMKQCG